MNLRKAVTNDLSGILSVNLKAIFESCSRCYSVEDLKQWVGNRNEESFRKNLENDQLYVSESNGEVLGFLDVVPGEILAIYTDPLHERKGIGTKLMDLGIEKAGKGVDEIVLYSSLNAVTFYERFGFQRKKEVQHPRNGINLPVIEMRYRKPQPVAGGDATR